MSDTHVDPALSADMPAAPPPAEGETEGSVFDLGVSPWMRGALDPTVVTAPLPAAPPPAAAEADVSVLHVAPSHWGRGVLEPAAAPPTGSTDASARHGRAPTWTHDSLDPTAAPTPPSPPPSGPPHGELFMRGIRSREQRDEELGKRLALRVLEEQVERDRGMAEEELMRRCRRSFFIGCLALPLVHFVNVMYYYPELRGSTGSFRMRKYIWFSLIVGMIESFLWILWFVVFQLLRDDDLRGVNILFADNVVMGLLG